MRTTTIFQSSGKRNRSKLLERKVADERPPLRLTQRRLKVIQAVYEYRALTSPQIDRLFYARGKGRETRCRKCLRQLFDHEYLWRDEQPTKLSQGRAPLVYRLDTKGADLLAETWGLERADLDWDSRDKNVSDPFLNHLLRTNDVRVDIAVAADKHGFVIAEWRDDKTLKREHSKDYVVITNEKGRKQQVAIVPDGYFCLSISGEDELTETHFFLEIDLRTVVGHASYWGRRDWNRKVKAYIEYFQNGKYEERYGARQGRVLTVTTGERRLDNLKSITEDAGGKKRFWFTTFDRVTPETVLTERIWQVASQRGLRALTR